MSDQLLKLTTYFGERDRSGGELLADELFAVIEQVTAQRGLVTVESVPVRVGPQA